MHCAQTNIQLFNQLRGTAYSQKDIAHIRDAYELAMEVFGGRFEASGKPFIAHVVGTASILASLRLSAPVIAAGLLHNAYEHGDFGMARRNATPGKRHRVKRLLGTEVEEYIANFAALHWGCPTVQFALDDTDRLNLLERNVLLIRLADYLEHLLDLDLLYFSPAVRRYFTNQGATAIRLAESFKLEWLAVELKRAIREIESTELPVHIPLPSLRDESFVIAPASCRTRLTVALRQVLVDGVNRCRNKYHRGLRLLSRMSTAVSKAFLRARQRYAIRSKPSSKPLEEYLQANSRAFGALFTNDAVLERVATGFDFTEGPVWIREERSLLFSDIPASRIYKLAPDGRVRIFRKPSGHSNGLTRDKEGRLIVCEHSNRRVTRTEKDGSITVLADRFQDKRLNSPNDVVVKSDGAIYFTDPPYGIPPAEQEQPIQGVYRLSPDGALTLVAGDFLVPNGLAFSPDEKRLYIDDSKRRHIRVCEVRDDGSLSEGLLFHDMNVSTPGVPDGMKIDALGRVYCTGAGGVWVFDVDGEHLGTIVTPEKPANCAWGGDDWQSLYITAVSSVYKFHVNVPGIPV